MIIFLDLSYIFHLMPVNAHLSVCRSPLTHSHIRLGVIPYKVIELKVLCAQLFIASCFVHVKNGVIHIKYHFSTSFNFWNFLSYISFAFLKNQRSYLTNDIFSIFSQFNSIRPLVIVLNEFGC